MSHTGGQPGGFFTRLEFSPETGKGTVLLVNRLDLVSTSGKKQNEPIAAYLNDYFDIVDKKSPGNSIGIPNYHGNAWKPHCGDGTGA